MASGANSAAANAGTNTGSSTGANLKNGGPGCGWNNAARTAYGGGTAADKMESAGSKNTGTPVGVNGLRPGEFVKYDQKGNALGLTGPYDNPNNSFNPASLDAGYRNPAADPGGWQQTFKGGIYANGYHQYNMEQIAMEAEKAVTDQISSIDITTLGFSPM